MNPEENGTPIDPIKLERDVWLLHPLIDTLELYYKQLTAILDKEEKTDQDAADAAGYIVTMEPQLVSCMRILAEYGVNPAAPPGLAGLIMQAEVYIARYAELKEMVSS